jgi:hypothetical protein
VLSVENWAEVRRLHRAGGMPIKTIARVMGISRNTVRAALRSDGPPKYERGLRGHPRSTHRLTRRPAPAASSATSTHGAKRSSSAARPGVLWPRPTCGGGEPQVNVSPGARPVLCMLVGSC